MTDLILLLQADLDIQAAFKRYEDYQPGRGEVFVRQNGGRWHFPDAPFPFLRPLMELELAAAAYLPAENVGQTFCLPVRTPS